jgi:parallel beta-helix repeat protein
VIERYQKDGVVVGGADSHAEITANRVLGIGRTTKIAQNGIEVLYATAGIKHNFVANNNYTPGTPTTDESTGILLYQSGNVATEHNTVAANGVGVYVFDAGAGSTTTKNHIRAGNNDGVAVDCSANCSVGSHVVDNKIEHNAGPGIGLYNGVQGNTIDDNQVKDNSNDFGNIPCTTAPPPPTPPCGGGIVLDDADGNIISNNHIKNNGTLNTVDNTDGIRVKAASNGNNIHDNHLKKNLTHDCHDDATPGSNTWTNNKGKTSMQVGPAPLCSQDDDDTFEAESAYGWDPSYPWYASFDSAADPDLDFATAYVGIDTDSILQLLPSIRLGSVLKRNVSP